MGSSQLWESHSRRMLSPEGMRGFCVQMASTSWLPTLGLQRPTPHQPSSTFHLLPKLVCINAIATANFQRIKNVIKSTEESTPTNQGERGQSSVKNAPTISTDTSEKEEEK